MEAIRKVITFKNVMEEDLKNLDDMKNNIDDDGFVISSIVNEYIKNKGHRLTVVYEKPHQDF